MKIDLHCHTEASWDCVTPLKSIPARCREQGIGVQAITDHDEIWGAKKLREMVRGTDLTVIVGEEITSRDGEIVGLFLEELIPPGMSAEETVAAIREQEGLVLLPHGFDPLKRKRLSPQARERIADEIDIVEIFNTRVSKPSWNTRARDWALEAGIPMSGGSDAHTLRDIGTAWCETPVREVGGPEELLLALLEGQVHGKWVHPAAALAYKVFDGLRYRLLGSKNLPAEQSQSFSLR